MCKLLEGSDKKNVVELVGNVGSSAANDRGQGFREKMDECGITITKSQTANWDATEGKAVMEALLKKSKDIQGVFGQNDEMGLGAAQALEEAGLKPGVDVKILTVDATKGAFKAMIAGRSTRSSSATRSSPPRCTRPPSRPQRRDPAQVGPLHRGRVPCGRGRRPPAEPQVLDVVGCPGPPGPGGPASHPADSTRQGQVGRG